MHAKLALGCVLLCLAAPAQAYIIETFDEGANGWSIVAYPFRGHVANPAMQPAPFDDAFGMPPGSLRIGDVYGETGAAAPAAFLGDQSALYGQLLTYDLYLRYVDVGATYPAVVLNGGTQSVYCDLPAPAADQWWGVRIGLTAEGWRVSGTGAPADEATFLAILTDLHGFYIYTEWHTGADDTNLDNVTILPGDLAVGDDLPAAVSLRPCAPNPFNPSTTIRFDLATAGPVRLDVLSADGRLVRTLVDERREAGPQAVVWNGRDSTGRLAASGTYFCRVEAHGESRSTRVTLVK